MIFLTSVLTSVFAVFDAIASWLVGAVEDLIPMFYGTDGLTFLGVLSVTSLGISVIFLLIGVIQGFLRFR